jgi:hypothetical protein
VEPPATDPADAPDAKADLDDLFGTPTETDPPAEMEPPATDPADAKADLDDLFGTPAETEPPAEVEPPATDPADAPDAKADLDDLFGSPAEPAPSAEPEATAPADADVNDLFGPAPEPKPATAPAEPADVEDLFGPVPSKKPAAADDPFGASSSLELPMRQWVDNTGNFRVRGRLLSLTTDSVKLLKENGRTASVPMRRLSQADQAYVQQIVSHGSRLGQLVSN